MRKLLLFALSLILSAAMHAQNDVTKFLGIPVDGTKAEMIRKLKAKGFVSTGVDGTLEGEFNGQKVYVSVVTNNRKVYRVAVADATERSETDIKIRFNNLCRQFNDNPKYGSGSDQTISDDENISNEMILHNKRYEAAFYQVSKSEMDSFFKSTYTEEQLANPTDEMRSVFVDFISKRSVWFMIDGKYGKYRILMYYDNGYNQADGEDL